MTDRYSAAQQGLGYLYQARFALLRIFQLPGNTSLLFEKDDDIDFIDENGNKSLASLKHKALGDKLTNLSIDFWRSINIWLKRYIENNKVQSSFQFILITTSTVSDDSILKNLLIDRTDNTLIVEDLLRELGKTKNKKIVPIYDQIKNLTIDIQRDFFSKISIIDSSIRIDNIPKQIMDNYMVAIRREYRKNVYERLEGWWFDQVIEMLTKNYNEALSKDDITDKLADIAEEFRLDDLPLPIEFKRAEPEESIDIENDQRLFVKQLKEIDVSEKRRERAILDYYRSYTLRSYWARENFLAINEIQDYEDRLIEEWGRYKDRCYDEFNIDDSKGALKAGKALYNKIEDSDSELLRIRRKVIERFVILGSFHILANYSEPKIYWHPKFLDNLKNIIKDEDDE